MTMICNAARSVGRDNLVDWCREIIAAAEALPREAAALEQVSPAAMPMELRFDDGGLSAGYRSRFHSSAPAGRAATRVHVLTGSSNGFETLAEWDDPSFQPKEFHARLKAAGLRAAYPFQKRLWRLFDERSRVGLQWCAAPSELPPWDGSAPLRQHLHWMLEDTGMRLAHAATLGLDKRGVILFGRGGAGKSGTTLAGLAAGLSTVGDDYIALGLSPRPLARPLYRMVKQDRAGLSRIQGLAGHAANLDVNWRGKAEFDPSAYFNGAFAAEMSIEAVILPRIAHAEKPSLVDVRPQAAMLALMTSNLHQFAGEEDDGMRFFSRFLAGMPCFQLDLSADARRNGDLLCHFVERLPG
ncbi:MULTISPECIES: hypothetical protein [unclassified Mesorhizobium]|uniref:hypothetical protein n=1 Tax=unclassified Mesorhizobium TaxID=325217 RepID=UPI000FCA2DF3|nr:MULTISPECIES: hypothetical protein [unclassified Mesorhizobium]TGP21952.1 hypothetical protein EN874_020970 [Mesorhizobium sp. M1D.F.Ca.ET.231.01.1.1]TGP30337.1 hypothetical protein EN877_19350 [Mesorhizobium sp. M1D.F.Ca.ET.234.01.1.1]TGS44413.1 hypothetical protein EN827_19345 [Mesorhizobium sp. M1D.F.Ca.ET.184.01.1.1]TGS60453.1 hypothetical protein EN826_019345 [Mesorhizobium sp. M1D.F.Ca.ET.183.01.1.1]